MIHVTKDKVFIENEIFMHAGDGVASIFIDVDSLPTEVTKCHFLGGEDGPFMRQMVLSRFGKISFFKKLKFCYKYLTL